MAERQRQYRSRKDKKRPPVAPPEIIPTVQDSVLAPVLELQRTIGNRRVAEINTQTPALTQQRPVLQRVDTGIRSKTATNHFTKAIFDYCTSTGNQTKTLADFKQQLADSVNVELKGAGVYQISIVNGASGASGEFDFATWAIELNEATAFPGATTVADLSTDQIKEVADTIYHESRHAEQWYRIARNRAGKALSQTATKRERQTAAATIANDMGIPANVALEACNNPLYASWSSKFGGGTDKKIEEAEAWDASIYGDNATYRNEIVLGDVNDDVEKLTEHLQDALAEFPNNYNTLSKKDRKTVQAASKIHRDQARPVKRRLVDAKTAVIQPEIDRINAIGNKTPNDTTMLNHLNVVKARIDVIDANFPTNKVPKLTTAATASQQMKDELYQAYLDLPEEADAWPTGEAVSTQYDHLVNSSVVTI